MPLELEGPVSPHSLPLLGPVSYCPITPDLGHLCPRELDVDSTGRERQPRVLVQVLWGVMGMEVPLFLSLSLSIDHHGTDVGVSVTRPAQNTTGSPVNQKGGTDSMKGLLMW